MPELPEVETARQLIADQALRRRIVAVDDADTFVCRPHSPGELRDALTGRSLTAASRRGKTMWCETSGTGRSAVPGPDLGIHLGMGGRIVVTSAGHATEGGGPARRDAQPRKPEWNRFTLQFADGGTLVLFDKRRLGRIRLNPDVGALGPDAAEVSAADFRALVSKGDIAVKARLLDQSKIAGIGNLLADEVLWKAKVSPAARTASLRRADADRLYRNLESALDSAIARGGVHTGDVIAARHPGGSCPRCGAEMKHGTVGGRSTWWCSREQALRGRDEVPDGVTHAVGQPEAPVRGYRDAAELLSPWYRPQRDLARRRDAADAGIGTEPQGAVRARDDVGRIGPARQRELRDGTAGRDAPDPLADPLGEPQRPVPSRGDPGGT